MGSGASATQDAPGGELRLPATGLRFSRRQQLALNSYVDNLYQQDQMGRMSVETEMMVESLVQRIVDGAGQRDPRFRCCHIIALHRGKKMRSRSLEYLVTLDAFPTLNAGHEECVLQEGPVGYGKVRVTGRLADKWEEFLTPNGYLCRDKLVERWVGLIARGAHARSSGGGAPRVLCVRAAAHALPYRYCYLEKVPPTQWASDQRLAIVEGAAWVMVRVGAGQAEAKLALALRGAGGSAAALCARTPLSHPLALLHYTAQQMGFHLVAVGPPSSLACGERAATWQLWSPALEAALDGHCSDDSAVGRVAGAINAIIDRTRTGVVQGSVRVLSRYAASCALRRHVAARRAGDRWGSADVSRHMLAILDELFSLCACGSPAGFVFPSTRAALTRRGARASAGEWAADGACLRGLMLHLHAETSHGEEIAPTPGEELEAALFRRWETMQREARAGPPPRRNLLYLRRLTRELLRVKGGAICDNHTTFRTNLIQATSLDQEPIEDLIHILAIMLDQARDLYLQNNFPQFKASGESDSNLSTYRSKKWNKLKDYYDASSACLIDAVRRDPDLRKEDLAEDHTMMSSILNWLQKGAKDDKKYLGPVLKPYLEDLFVSSMENCWFLEDFDAKKCAKEYEGLGDYCMGVHDGKVDPCMGLLDAAKKFAWAKSMMDFVDRSRHVELRVVFPTGDGMAVSFPVRLPARRERGSARALTLARRDKAEAKLRLATRCVLAAFTDAILGDHGLNSEENTRQGSSEEILESVKSGNYWRNQTKPDIIPSSANQDISSDTLPRVVKRRSRRTRPFTSYGFPEISITDQSDPQTMRRKYHTLKNLSYTEPVESIKEMKKRPRSAGSTIRSKETMTRPSLLETLDFINGVKDSISVEESCTSDAEEGGWGALEAWLLAHSQPLAVLARRSSLGLLHPALGDMVPQLLLRGKFTALQELCGWLREPRAGALLALHRLARAARSRSSERPLSSWKLPEAEGTLPEPQQRYRARPADYVSGDEVPQPPPLPRTASKKLISQRSFSDFIPPKRLQDLEAHIRNLELMQSNLNLTEHLSKTHPTKLLNENYTGILNPLYDEKKIPKDKFSTKRSKSLGRSFSTRKVGLEVSRYNITLGHKGGRKTNDVITALAETTGETGLDSKNNFFQRYSSTASVVGDSYRVSRITID